METIDLESFWHPTKNITTLDALPPKSNKKVWWLGKECGHEWEMSLYQIRALTGVLCPYCRNSKILVGFNDLPRVWDAGKVRWVKNYSILDREVPY